MTKTITLKQAYESIGETIKVEDHLQDAGIVKFVDGWYFDYCTCPLTTCVASNWKIPENYVITRNGKQIYPKVEVDTEALSKVESSYSKTQLVRGLTEVCIGVGLAEAAKLEDLISKLIDAKIKEKMGDKC